VALIAIAALALLAVFLTETGRLAGPLF